MRADLVGILEAAYRFDAPDADWLGCLVDAAKPGLDRGHGVVAYLYDASDPTRFRVGTVLAPEDGVVSPSTIRHMAAAVDPAYVQASWRSALCARAREIPASDDMTRATAAWMESLGIADILGVNGVDPTGIGCWIGAPMPKRAAKLRAGERAMWSRVAAHVAAGYRLRRRFAANDAAPREPEDAEAVLAPDGKVVHASAEATLRESRDALRDAVRVVERARASRGRGDPERSVDGWKALVSARWTLVDQFDSDGRRFVVARRNEPVRGAIERLSERELQVVGFAIMGHSNKLIAYELGIAHSTVRVLLSRAAAKMNARSREALLEAVRGVDRPESASGPKK